MPSAFAQFYLCLKQELLTLTDCELRGKERWHLQEDKLRPQKRHLWNLFFAIFLCFELVLFIKMYFIWWLFITDLWKLPVIFSKNRDLTLLWDEMAHCLLISFNITKHVASWSKTLWMFGSDRVQVADHKRLSNMLMYDGLLHLKLASSHIALCPVWEHPYVIIIIIRTSFINAGKMNPESNRCSFKTNLTMESYFISLLLVWTNRQGDNLAFSSAFKPN